MLSLACAFPGANDLDVPRNAPFIELGLRDTDTLACDAGRCEKWYRLAVHKSQRISIEVSSDADPVAADFGVVLYDGDLEVVTRNNTPHQRPRQLSAELDRGLYSLRIEKLTGLDSPMRFRLRAIAGPLSRFTLPAPSEPPDRPAPSKPPDLPTTSPGIAPEPPHPPRHSAPRPPRHSTPRPPRHPAPRPALRPTRPSIPLIPDKPARAPMMAPGTLIRSDVIEVERADGVPIAVLIEAGIPTGVSRGQLGRLVEAGREIGRIEIVDVYSGGSRARILGELSGPITANSVVEVFDPTE